MIRGRVKNFSDQVSADQVSANKAQTHLLGHQLLWTRSSSPRLMASVSHVFRMLRLNSRPTLRFGVNQGNARLHPKCAMSTTTSKVVVRWPGGQENIAISIETPLGSKSLDRDPEEPLHKSLGRLELALAKLQGGKNKKSKAKKGGKAQADSASLAVRLVKSQSTSDPVPPDTPNYKAWIPPAALVIGESVISLEYNPPTVAALEVPPRPMPGYPIFPLVELQHSDADSCLWEWFRVPSDGIKPASGVNFSTTPVSVNCKQKVYTPEDSDVGHFLEVRCTPVIEESGIIRHGETACARSSLVEVVGLTEREDRGCFPCRLPPTNGTKFRVITYNILADQYSSQEYAQKVLFAHVPADILDVHYRKQAVLQEIINSNADVVCLQEVDAKVFSRYFQPLLKLQGMSGWYANKAGQVTEGSAMFFREAKFDLLTKARVDLPELFTGPLPDHLSEFTPLLDASPHLVDALQSVTTIAQISVLRPRFAAATAGPAVVANTHLFFHADAAHIRTMHVTAILREAERHAAGHPNATLVFCGDLNSDLNDGTPGSVHLLSTGSLPRDYWDWSTGARFSFDTGRDDVAREAEIDAASQPKDHVVSPNKQQGGKDLVHTAPIPEVTGVDINLSRRFTTAHPLQADLYTNYVPGFKGLLDYIWIDSGLETVKAHAIPPADDLAGFIPNSKHPSDHLPVVADFRLTAAGANVLRAEDENVREAARMLASGGVVALPTDTIYGLAAIATDDAAIGRIYDIKGRDASVPLSVCVATLEQVGQCGVIENLPEGTIRSLMPGAVTVVLRRRSDAPLSKCLNPGEAGVGIRIPAYGFTQRVVSELGKPIVLTSANRSGEPSTVDASEFRDLWPEVDYVFDGGRIESDGQGSTIVDFQGCSESQGWLYTVLRDGSALENTSRVLRGLGMRPA